MIQLLIALAACLAAWTLVLRAGVGARPWPATPALAGILDSAPVLLGFAAMLGATARPLLSGLAIVGLTAGLSIADRVKRVVLHEPVVFADRAELPEVVRHPGLYFPFAAGPPVIVAIVAAGAAAIALLAWAEPPVWARTLPAAAIEAALAIVLAAACFALPGAIPHLLQRLAALYNARLAPSRDPVQDAVSLGPLATLCVHATLAAAERPLRRRSAASRPALALPAGQGPVVVVQAESFLDPARIHPDLADLLPTFNRLRAAARQSGRLDVPAWGANTVRSEFAVLTGIPEDFLGLDYFNPYEKFARAPGPALPSLARAARAAGCRTVFVHPFDLGFYSRRHVLPPLGFDELVGPAAFARSPRIGPYVADAAVGEIAAGLIRQHGPRVFIYIATMQAHGPWDAAGPGIDLPAAVRQMPGAAALGRWLYHLQGTDQLLAILAETLAHNKGWLAFFGDHQPSMPETFAAAGLTDRRTDYLIWRARADAGPTQDIQAHELGAALLTAMAAP